MGRATARRSQLLAVSVTTCRRLRFHGTQLGLIGLVSTETASVPAIDISAITQLAEVDELGERFIAEIIDVFLGDLSERVRTIGLQINRADRAGVSATAHAIKGSCGHFGAMRLVELCRELEDRARREPGGDIQTAIDSMVAEAERVRAAVEAYRSEHARP